MARAAASQIQASTITGSGRALFRPVIFGLLAVMGLLAFYLGIITLAQGWGHALEQLTDGRRFVGTIAIKFGTQVGQVVVTVPLSSVTAAPA